MKNIDADTSNTHKEYANGKNLGSENYWKHALKFYNKIKFRR